MLVTRSSFVRSPSVLAPLTLAAFLGAPLDAQSAKLNGPLAPGRGALAAFRIAPDGATVVYSAQLDGAEFDLYRVAFAGGPSTRVNTPSAGSSLDPYRFEITPDSAHVVFTTTSGPTRRDLFAAPLAGGPAVELDQGPADGRLVDGTLALTPDGQRALFVVAIPTDQRFLVSVAITGGVPVLVAGPASGFGRALPTPDSAQVVFTADLEVAGRFEVQRAPVDGSAAPVRLGPVPTRNGDASALALSSDGQWVAFVSTLDTTRPVLYAVPLAGGPALALDPASNSSVEPSPTLTADGARVLFQDGIALALHSAPIDGSAPAVVLAPGLRIGRFVPSPDGSRVVFVENASSAGARLYSVPAAGGTLVQLSAPGLVAGASFQFSPDGADVLYRARPEGASASNLYRVPVAGGASMELYSGVQDWILAPDGARIALVAADFGTFSVPVAGGSAASLAPASTLPVFSPDSRSVLFGAALDASEPVNLYRMAATGPGRLVQLNGPLAELPAPLGVDGFELLPAEKRVLYLGHEGEPGGVELYAVESAGLERGRLDPDAGPGHAWVTSFRTTPDGARAIFGQVGPDGFALYTATTESGLARRLTPFLSTTPGPFDPGVENIPYASAPGSRAAAFVADLEQDGQRDLYRVRLRSGSPVRLNPPLVPGGNVWEFAFAPAGGRLVYRADQELAGRIELYSVLASIGPASAVKLSAPLEAGSEVGGFAIDPTGARVVYRTEGTRRLFVARTDGLGAATEILRADGTPASLSEDLYALSSDGSRVVFPLFPLFDFSGLHSAPLAGGPTVELGADLGAFQVGGGTALAPDSSRVAFSARLTPDESRLYTAPLAGGPSTEIAVGGGTARFTNASDRVLYRASNGSGLGLFVAPATGGASVLLSGGLSVTAYALRADDQIVGFTTGRDLYVARLDGQGVPQRVNEFDAEVEDTFVLGAERIFFAAGPVQTPNPRELYSRAYPSLP